MLNTIMKSATPPMIHLSVFDFGAEEADAAASPVRVPFSPFDSSQGAPHTQNEDLIEFGVSQLAIFYRRRQLMVGCDNLFTSGGKYFYRFAVRHTEHSSGVSNPTAASQYSIPQDLVVNWPKADETA